MISVALMACVVGIAARSDRNERSVSTVALCLMSTAVALFLCAKWAVLGMLPAVADVMLMALYGGMLGAMLLGGVFVARGDIVIIMITGVLLPSVYGVPTLVITLGIAFLVSLVYCIAKTFVPNLRELVRTRRVFAGIDDSVVRKAAAFLIVHRRAPNERFCFPGETSSSGCRRLVLFPRDLDHIDIEARTEYVITAIPFMIPYFVGVCVLAATVSLGIA